MPFDWRELLDMGNYLHTQAASCPSPEAALRSAASRAYFAAYGHAKRVAIKNDGFQPSMNVDDHEKLWRHYSTSGRKDIADKLKDLRQWRNKCDYDEVVADPKRLAS